MAGEALSSSPVFSQNPIPDWSDTYKAVKSICITLHSVLCALQSFRSGNPQVQEAKDFQNNSLFDKIDSFILDLTSEIYKKDLLEAQKQVEEKDVLVASLRYKEEEQAQIKQAQAESTLREMQMKEKEKDRPAP
ncbi:hypothetical protein PanWU01x14_254250 [Parasponia andersonii]|uniref:Uncharacterized protein n=1 Tax=Parasponia andersonii TaxID=3476 RepID=A0A2P5BBF7_PARAD|nr:hypothetical protein PanWU01x14_254250 [Parasponia andersonii]